ncbi:MAG: hypothetical protein IKD46_03765 [Lentisphaeria bacterium]|nr:hypothetical protein [Lentisphaeria bacterium]
MKKAGLETLWRQRNIIRIAAGLPPASAQNSNAHSGTRQRLRTAAHLSQP